MEKTVAPFVYWAQSNTEVSLRVDLRDVAEPEVQVEEEEIDFVAVGMGSHGEQRYSFTLEFYLPIRKDFTYELTDREVRIKLTKKEPDWWPRLLYEQKKLPWLRVDFDRIKHESETEEEDGDKPSVSYEDMLRTKYPDAYEKLQKEELGFLNESWRKCYLFVYNLFMFCGFLYALIVMSLSTQPTKKVSPQSAGKLLGTYSSSCTCSCTSRC